MTYRLNRHTISVAIVSGVFCCATVFSQTAPDNTKVNKADRAAGQPTADQGKNDKSDRTIMQQIRRAVVADKSLSTYAHNVKIISEHGKVTLRGPVHTDDERKSIESKATEVAGAGNVDNQITVKPAKSK